MTIQAIVVFALLAAIIIPVVASELARNGRRRPAPKPPEPPRREPVAKTPLRLVVNKNDMDRELAALLAKDSRKSTETED